ncbi:TolC family protein [Flavobacteriaceae bacterium R38]|nr:TolC family protein [Flavobacteriaceae bacterium R38]
MKNNFLFLLIPSLLFSISIFSQEKTYSFSLEEAIQFALENNKDANNATRDIEIAKKQKWEATASGLPQISISGDYQNFLKQQVTLFDTNGDGIDEEFTFGTSQSVNAFARLDQKIFDGPYIVALQAAKVFLKISQNAKVKTDSEIRKGVISAYGNVLLTEESVQILIENQKVLQKNVDETRKIVENGLGEEEDLEQLQITLANVTSNLNNTKRLKDVAYKFLNIALGINLNTEVTLTDQLENLAVQNINNNLAVEDLVVENNIDFKIASNNVKAQELQVKLEKSRALPSLNAFINGGYQGFSDEFSFFDSGQRYFGTSAFGLSLNVPIFSSGERAAKTQRAKIELEKVKAELTHTEQQLQLDLSNARSNYLFAIENYQTSKQNLSLAERIERKNQVKYTEGIATSFELRQAQTQLYTTQQEYLQAMLDVINNKAELEVILNSNTK